jgi:glycosyltransferase involved in cell wall biosynthesis
LGPNKGIPVLIEAIERLKARLPAVRLVLAGGPEATRRGEDFGREIRARIEGSPARDAIHLRGFVPADELDALLDSADAVALPYTGAPGFSSSAVAFRAAAAGLPIVATEFGTMGEHVRHGRTGLIVPPGDPGSVANALETLAREEDLRLDLGGRARRHLDRWHSPEAIAKIVDEEYERVIMK